MIYGRLHNELRAQRISTTELGRVIGTSHAGVSRRMNGKTPWTIAEAYKVLNYLGIDQTLVFDYFPPGGIEPSISGELTLAEQARVDAAISKYKQSILAVLAK